MRAIKFILKVSIVALVQILAVGIQSCLLITVAMLGGNRR